MFTYVLGSRESTKNLRAFLSAVQQDSGYPAVRELEIENAFNLQTTKRDTRSVIDVRAVDEDGSRYNVEAPALGHRAFAERPVYNSARAYGSQLERWLYSMQNDPKEDETVKVLLHEDRDTREETACKEGREEGREEGQVGALRKVARTMKRQNRPVSEIQRMTGPTAEEINEL